MSLPGLRDVAFSEQTGMFKKLNTLTPAEWDELTKWMSARFEQEIEDRGMALYYKRDIDRMVKALDRHNRRP